MSDERAAVDGQILHGAPLAMAAVEGPMHIVRDVNDTFCRLVQKDRLVLLGVPFADIAPGGGEKECIALLDRVYRTGEPETLANEPQPFPATDQPAYWSYSAWVSTGEDRSGEGDAPVGVVVQVTDTTEDYNFHEMAALMNQELIVTSVRLHEQTDAMAQADRAKDEFLAMLGHELRNPLGAISNAAYFVQMQIAGQDSLQKPVTMILRQVRHSARLVEDLLDVSRITHGKLGLRKASVELASILRRAEDVAQPQMELAGCSFSVSTPTEPVWMIGDAARLEQTFGNLLNNAAKYSEAGGSVNVTLRSEASEAVVEVRDTGVGIAPEMLPRIFDLFVQEERSLGRSRGGLGIGLTLVKTLTELHGGTVSVESAGLGLGSTFTVRLPLSPERGTGRRADAPRSKDNTASQHILLVEDNVNVAQPLARVLEMWGHIVRMAHDGPSAIEIASRATPDIVLLDIGLPMMDGYEVARTLRALPGMERVRIVALTGYGSEADRSRASEARFDDYLMKPLDFVELQGTLVTVPG